MVVSSTDKAHDTTERAHWEATRTDWVTPKDPQEGTMGDAPQGGSSPQLREDNKEEQEEQVMANQVDGDYDSSI